jgi:hypothetical protein
LFPFTDRCAISGGEGFRYVYVLHSPADRTGGDRSRAAVQQPGAERLAGNEAVEGFDAESELECVFGVLALESEPVDPRL